MSGLQHVTTLGEGHGICSNTRGDFPLSTQRQGHTPNTQPNNDNLKLNHDHEKEEGRTSSKTEEKNEGKYSEMSFDIRPKNVRSLRSVDRFDERFKEIERFKWDAILLGETWRPAEEIWESKSGHIFMGACFNQKHGVRILFNTKMEAKDLKNRMCQRKHQPRRIVLAGVCFHHTGYSDVHIEKMRTCVETWKTYYGHRGWFQRPTCSWRRIRKWPRWKARAGRIQQAWYWDEAVVDDPKLRGAEHEIQNQDPKRKDSLRKSTRCTMHVETTEASETHVFTEGAHELARRYAELENRFTKQACGSGTERKKTKRRDNWSVTTEYIRCSSKNRRR